jgi:hypothetical protein
MLTAHRWVVGQAALSRRPITFLLREPLHVWQCA